MRPISRILVAVAALLLLVLYVQPMWRIDLEAPQYPEGLGLRIWVNEIRGAQPHQLEAINGLNHYIGMKEIVPDQIAELKYMPWVVGGLAILALLVALTGRRWLLTVLVVALLVAALAGLADFWKWGYDYGHDLDPTAAIKVPGMSYQPPLIGSKKLLNFRATSWPDIGGLAALAATALVAVAGLVEWRGRRRGAPVLLVLAVACSTGPRPIALGAEECAHCHMRVSDARFAAELVTRTGKVYVFDDVGCMLDFVSGGAVPEAQVRSMWAMDYHEPGTLRPRTELTFLHTDSIPTPMGSGIIAVRHGAPATPRTLPGGSSHAGASRPDQPGRSLAALIANAAPGARVVVPAGTYHLEQELLLARPITLVGEGLPVIEGNGNTGLMRITADRVRIEGFEFRNVGTSFMDDRAALRFEGVTGCQVVGNRFSDTFFGVFLARSSGCDIRHNAFRGQGGTETHSGNAVHLWNSTSTTIVGNDISGHRDGIYLEFARHVVVQGNRSSANHRYGLHFMFSDSSAYEDNTFERNAAGIAVMYTKQVAMRRNRFAGHQGAGAYGLLLKDIGHGELDGNVFTGNTTALFMEGTSHVAFTRNLFDQNGWAIRLRGNSEENHFTGNHFTGNAFDVATNGRSQTSTFDGNTWDQYRGYDLDRDGTGDVPHPPVRLFSIVVEQQAGSVILLRSLLVDLLDVAERVLPVLVPTTLTDMHPRMAAS